MNLEADLRTFLLARVEQAAAGVWWMAVPQGVEVGRGALVLQRIATVPAYSLDGAIGYTEATIQVDCWADRAVDVIALADAVRIAVHSFAGDGPSSDTIGSTFVHMIKIEGMRDIDEPELPHYRRSIDLAVTYREA